MKTLESAVALLAGLHVKLGIAVQDLGNCEAISKTTLKRSLQMPG